MMTAIGYTLTRVSDFEGKRKRSFGKRVRDLRERRKLSRNQLEGKSGVPERTIIDVENGDKAVLDRKTVSLLVQAFGLNGLAEREFVLAAGLSPDAPLNTGEHYRIAHRFYEQMDYPALITNGLLDLHSCNAYLLAMLNLPTTLLDNCAYEGGGPNVLRFLFDPHMGARETWRDSWAAVALWNVYYFRLVSQPHIHEPRYAQLLEALRPLPDFEAMWQVVDGLNGMPMPPHSSTLSGVFGTLRVLHTEAITNEILDNHLRAVLYVPMDDATQHAFAQLRTQTPRQAFQFGSCAVGRYTRIL
jgi:transcriptional regulator with XRE-family HTH domain